MRLALEEQQKYIEYLIKNPIKELGFLIRVRENLGYDNTDLEERLNKMRREEKLKRILNG